MSLPSRILAIDPGPSSSGYVLLAGATVEVSGVLPNVEILSAVLPAALESGALLAVEEMAGQGPNRPVGLDEFRTARWSGRFEQRWLDRGGAPPRFVLRREVKLALLNASSGNDAQVRCALLNLWGGEETALGPKSQKVKKGEAKIRGPLYGVSSHAWQALAVAVTVRELLEREAAAAAPVGAGAPSVPAVQGGAA